EGLEVLLEVGSQRGLVERGRGVEHREDRDAILLSGTSVDARDGFAGKELVHGVAAEGHDDLRPEHGEVAREPHVASGHPLRPRVRPMDVATSSWAYVSAKRGLGARSWAFTTRGAFSGSAAAAFRSTSAWSPGGSR